MIRVLSELVKPKGRLQPLGFPFRMGRKTYVVCSCACGAVLVVRKDHMQTDNTLSCGCLHTEAATTHGMKNSSEYVIFRGMHTRCSNLKAVNYDDYGGRGISVCSRWFDFALFLADMGMRPGSEYSIERKDTNGNYEPENCMWATPVEQQNNKRSNVRLEIEGVVKTIANWSRESGVPPQTIRWRLRKGWSVYDSVWVGVRHKEKNSV